MRDLAPLDIAQAIVLAVRRLVPHSPNLSTGVQKSIADFSLLHHVRYRRQSDSLGRILKNAHRYPNAPIPKTLFSLLLEHYAEFENESIYLIICTIKIYSDKSNPKSPTTLTPVCVLSPRFPDWIDKENMPTVIPLERCRCTDEKSTMAYSVMQGVGNCFELVLIIQFYFQKYATPELKDFSILMGNLEGDHVFLILYQNSPHYSLESVIKEIDFPDFETCCQFISSNTSTAILIDPWLTLAVDVRDYYTLLKRADELGVSRNFEGEVNFDSYQPCLFEPMNDDKQEKNDIFADALKKVKTEIDRRLLELSSRSAARNSL